MTIMSDRWIKRQCLPITAEGAAVYEGKLLDGRTPLIDHKHKYGEFIDRDSGRSVSQGSPYDLLDVATGLTTYYERILPLDPIESREKYPPMIEPFEPSQVKTKERLGYANGQPACIHHDKIVSYGTSSYGYDVRLAEEFRIFSNVNSTIIDPKKLDEKCLLAGELREDDDGSKYVILPPNSYLLGHTIEVFNIPKDIMVVAVGKSTYARAGAIVNVTPIEPAFRGTVVIEISNSTPLPLKVYANEGIAQFLFFAGNEACETTYADRNGKYQDQRGIVLAKA